RLTTTDTGLGGLGARGGTEVVDLERVLLRHDQSTSSTVTRWRTVCTMPRNSGRSSLTTCVLIPLRPRERRVSRWFCLLPMAAMSCVILLCAMITRPPRRVHGEEPRGRRPRAADHGGPRSPRDAAGHGGPPRSRARC